MELVVPSGKQNPVPEEKGDWKKGNAGLGWVGLGWLGLGWVVHWTYNSAGPASSFLFPHCQLCVELFLSVLLQDFSLGKKKYCFPTVGSFECGALYVRLDNTAILYTLTKLSPG